MTNCLIFKQFRWHEYFLSACILPFLQLLQIVSASPRVLWLFVYVYGICLIKVHYRYVINCDMCPRAEISCSRFSANSVTQSPQGFSPPKGFVGVFPLSGTPLARSDSSTSTSTLPAHPRNPYANRRSLPAWGTGILSPGRAGSEHKSERDRMDPGWCPRKCFPVLSARDPDCFLGLCSKSNPSLEVFLANNFQKLSFCEMSHL